MFWKSNKLDYAAAKEITSQLGKAMSEIEEASKPLNKEGSFSPKDLKIYTEKINEHRELLLLILTSARLAFYTFSKFNHTMANCLVNLHEDNEEVRKEGLERLADIQGMLYEDIIAICDGACEKYKNRDPQEVLKEQFMTALRNSLKEAARRKEAGESLFIKCNDKNCKNEHRSGPNCQ